MSQSLSETEIKNRLQELRNLRQLHTTARERVIKLEAENKELKTEIKELKAILDNKDKRFDDLSLQLQELKVKVFGQKRLPATGRYKLRETKTRTASSYRRKTPTTAEITETLEHRVNNCRSCGGILSNQKNREFYEEDIEPLPPKKVIKHLVWSGNCTSCGRQTTAIKIPPQKVVIGQNIRQQITPAFATKHPKSLISA